MKLPEGFILDAPSPKKISLPDGFVLDAPESTEQAKTMGVAQALDNPVGDFMAGLGRGVATVGEGAVGLGMDALNALGLVGDEKTEKYDNYTAGTREDFNEGIGQSTTAKVGEFVGEMAPLALVPGAGLARGGLLARGSKIGAAGAVEGALISDTGDQLTGAAIGGAVAPLAAGGAGMIASRLAKRKVDDAVSDAIPDRASLQARASGIYKELSDSGIEIGQDAMEDLYTQASIRAKNFGHHPKIQSGSAAALGELDRLRMGDASFDDLNNARKILGNLRKSADPSERALSSQIIDVLDNKIDELTDGDLVSGSAQDVGAKFSEARGLWAKAKKSEVLEEAIEKAKTQASGFENGLRRQFDAILRSKNKARGFSEDELTAMRRVVNGEPLGNFSKFIGKFGFSEQQATSMLGSAVGIAGGASLGGPVGAVLVPTVAQGFKKLSQKITRDNAELAAQIVRAGKNPRSITKAYLKSGGKDSKELAALLAESGVDMGTLNKSVQNLTGPKRKILTDSISLITASSAAND